MLQALLLAATLAAAGGEKPKLIVLNFTAAGGVETEVAGALSEAVTAEVASRGFFAVLSSREVQTMVGLERQKQMMGCAEESTCLTELAGAMGARFVISGTVAKLGDAYQLSLQTLDTAKAQPIGRSMRLANDLSALRAQLPYSVAEATGTPLPPPPSRLLSYSLIGVGALALVGGGLLGQDALSRERSVNEELAHGSTTGGVLRSYAEYEKARTEIGQGKTLAVIGLGIGAALIGTGIVLIPSEGSGPVSSQVKVAVTPTTNGFSIAGVFP
jgi:hypothetical protein